MLESEERVDYNQIAYYPSICANRWAPDGSVQSITVFVCVHWGCKIAVYTQSVLFIPFPGVGHLTCPKKQKESPYFILTPNIKKKQKMLI